MKKIKIYVTCMAILISQSIIAGPCLDGFQTSMAAPTVTYYQAVNGGCQSNTWGSYYCLIEAEQVYEQALDGAIGSYNDCCQGSSELGC